MKLTVWKLLFLAPLTFIASLVLMSVFYGSQGLSENEISIKITESISYILLYSQILLFLMLVKYSRQNNVNLIKNTFSSKNPKQDIIFGIILGSLLAFGYFKFGIMEFVTSLQVTFGDYIPPGETSVNVGASIIIFFIANVVFAPFVEENIYRSIAFQYILEKQNKVSAVLLTSVFFGLLHWMGGFWYILTTAVLIGIPFGIIQLKRETILLVFTAHFTLNLIEFIFAL